MSTVSSNLSLPYIQANQAQKHVTHNEGMRILDSLTQLSVISVTDTAAPATPTPGDRYIVGTSATGDWAGQDGALAVWDENTWRFFAPQDGWMAWDQGVGAQLIYSGGQWLPTVSDMQNLDMVGINTTADTANRLAVSSDATLLTHDASGDHQLKINKDTATHTASLLLQTGWSGRAEMGTTGSDDFEVKVSSDGATFHQAIVVDHTTGEVDFPNTNFGGSAFGDGELLTVDYMTAKGVDLVTNGTGLLGNNYNMPSDFIYDATDTPNLPGAFSFSGYYPGLREITEFLPVDPNQVYELGCYLKQQPQPGDWSAFANGDRHRHLIGLTSYDIDKNQISAKHHMRYTSSLGDSRTTLTQPLTPGDMVVHVADAAAWNESQTQTYRRGITILAYKNSLGGTYNDYSRFVEFGLFDLSGVDKVNNIITLNTPLPASLANPDDPNGTWPVGTSLANCASGGSYKYSLIQTAVLPTSGDWYHIENHMGGLDRSGKNVTENFAPGTAYVKLFWLPNYTNRSAGFSGYPNTGAAHKVLFAGASVRPKAVAAMNTNGDGSVALKVSQTDFAAGSVSLVPTAEILTLL